MDLLQITTNLRFSLPYKLTQPLALHNSSLQQLAVLVLPSHPENYHSIPLLIVPPCETISIQISIRFYEDGSVAQFFNNQLIVQVSPSLADLSQQQFNRRLITGQDSQTYTVSVQVQPDEHFKISQRLQTYPFVYKLCKVFPTRLFEPDQNKLRIMDLWQKGKIKSTISCDSCLIVQFQQDSQISQCLIRSSQHGIYSLFKMPLISYLKVQKEQKKHPVKNSFAEVQRQPEPLQLFFDDQEKNEKETLSHRQQTVLFFQSRVLQALFVSTVNQQFLFLLTESTLSVVNSSLRIFSIQFRLQSQDYKIVLKQADEKVLLACQNTFYAITVDLGLQKILVRQYVVQRKIIQDMTLFEPLNAVAVVGRNISKLSFMGKTTSRLNIKFYQLAFPFDYLGSIQIGNQGGRIVSCNYFQSLQAICLVVTDKQPSQILFLAGTVIKNLQITCRIDLDDLGLRTIIDCIKFEEAILILEAHRGHYYIKLFNPKEMRVIILNKQTQMPFVRLTGFVGKIGAFGYGQIAELQEGTWTNIRSGQIGVLSGMGLWSSKNQQLFLQWHE